MRSRYKPIYIIKAEWFQFHDYEERAVARPLRDMIETIEIEKCTGCGICDIVCPADVIHMEPAPVAEEVPGLRQTKLLPVIKFREHCITCFSCEIFCPEHIVDVHPSVKNRPRPW